MAIDTKPSHQLFAANVTISSKRQITIPAAMARELGLETGDKLVARLEDGSIVLHRRPKDLLAYLDTFPKGVYGQTKEEIDAYIAEGRRDRSFPGLGEPESETE